MPGLKLKVTIHTCIAWKSRVEYICSCPNIRRSVSQRRSRGDGTHARHTMMHFLPLSLSSLQSSDRGAPRSPSNVYVELGSSCVDWDKGAKAPDVSGGRRCVMLKDIPR